MVKTATRESLSAPASSPDLDEEIAVDEYARQNGLSRDFNFDVSTVHSLMSKAQFSLTSTHEADVVWNGEHLPALRIPFAASVTEQPSITKASAKLLSSAMSRNTDKYAAAFAFDASRVRQARLMEVEVPLLRSDHESDYRALLRSINSLRNVKMNANSLPSEPLDTDHDEDLEFPPDAYTHRAKLEASTQVNRLSVPKDTICYLEEALTVSRTDTETLGLLQQEWPDPMANRTIELTPPLLERAVMQELFLPNSEDCQVPIWSDSSLLQADLASAEAALLNEVVNESEFDEANAHLTELLRSPSPSTELSCIDPHTLTLNDLKVDEPLFPSRSISSPLDLVIGLQHAANTVRLDDDDAGPVSSPDGGGIVSMFSDELQNELEAAAAERVRSIEQEQLEIHEAKARVKVPVVDFNIRAPQWSTEGGDAAAQLQHLKEKYQGLTIPHWSIASEAGLWWNPFPKKLGQIGLEEVNQGQYEISSAFTYIMPGAAATSADFVEKQSGFAILRDHDDDDDDVFMKLIKAPMENTKDMQTLLRKRKLEYDIPEPTRSSSSDQLSPVQLVNISRSFSRVIRSQSKPTGNPTKLLVDSSDPSATATLLANYVDVHTSKKQKTSKSPFFSQKESRDEVSDTGPPAIILPEKISSVLPTSLPHTNLIKTLPCPDVDIRSEPTKIIVALSVPTPLLTGVRVLLPNAEMIERDFDTWNAVIWDRSSVSRSPIISSLAAEADFIISPSTAIVTTTFIKAIQKPPLGHKGKAVIRERLEKVSTRYERLVVLVSIANRADIGSLSPSECTAYAEFSGFIASLETTTIVYFVAGGIDILCRWIASFITRYSSEAVKAHDLLIDGETTWELFLRRAGMNAYAAQIILAHMKAPKDASEDSLGRYGLSGFVSMTEEERVMEFSQLVGGERVLRRVSAVLDSGWN